VLRELRNMAVGYCCGVLFFVGWVIHSAGGEKIGGIDWDVTFIFSHFAGIMAAAVMYLVTPSEKK
jgi:hypothetical protein